MKVISSFVVLASLVGSPVLAQSSATESYAIYLHFDEKEFIDYLTLRRKPDGTLEGKMVVPKDFTSKLENIVVKGRSLSFDLFVPKNPSRPTDLVFHYEAHFHDGTRKQLAGFVTLKGQSSFIASFVGFRQADQVEAIQ